MTAQAQTSGGGVVAVGLLAGLVVLACALPAAGRLVTALDAQPIPPQPTVAIPPPAPAMLAMGLGTVMLADAGTMAIPEGAVAKGTHAGERHTEEEAEAVRQAVAAAIIAEPILGQQPPCKDGRHRLVVPMGNAWGVWVLQQRAPGLYDEITAFKTSNQAYVRHVTDDCGNGSWWGHAYGG